MTSPSDDPLDLGATQRGHAAGQRVFQRYTLQRLLGRGGMGVVWLAHDEELQRDVALKFLPEVVALDREAIAELKRETRRNLELTHPHIVRVYDFIQDGRGAAISIEYVDGPTLAALKVEQPHHIFSVSTLRPWLEQLAAALGHAHAEARIVHRDLKPANLMIDRHGRLKVTDFGIARSVADSVSRVSNHANSSGTVVYMSPQQMMGEPPAVTDDIYAIGSTLYELLTGKPPFYTGNVVLQVQNKLPPSIADRRAELGVVTAEPVPPAWEAAIRACLAKEPAARPASLADLLQRLAAAPVAAVLAAPAPPPPPAAAPAPAAPAPPPVENSTKTSVFIAAAAALVFLLGGGLWWILRAPPMVPDHPAHDRPEVASPSADVALPVDDDPIAVTSEPAYLLAQAAAEAEAARDALLARIDAFDPQADATALDALATDVQAYLLNGDPTSRAVVEPRWSAQRTAWEQARRSSAVLVQTHPDDAEISWDGDSRRSPTLIQRLPAGPFRFTVRKPGYEPREVTLDLAVGQTLQPPPIELAPVLHPVQLSSLAPGTRYELLAPFAAGAPGARGELPATVRLPVGSHSIRYSREGYGVRDALLTVVEGGGAAPAADLRGAALRFTLEPAGAALTLNGRPVTGAPLTLDDLPPGDYTLTASAPDFDPVTRQRRLALGETWQEHLPLPPNAQAVFLRKLRGHWAAGLGGLRFEDTSGRGTYRAGSNLPWSSTNLDLTLVHFDAETQTAEFESSDTKRLPNIKVQLRGTVPHLIWYSGRKKYEIPYQPVTPEYWNKL